MRTKPSVRPAVVPFFSLMLVAMLFVTASSPADAACPSGLSYPVTSGDPAAGPRIVLTGLGAHPEASFFLLGSGDDNNSGGLSAADWLKPVGDIDGDGLPDWIVDDVCAQWPEAQPGLLFEQSSGCGWRRAGLLQV